MKASSSENDRPPKNPWWNPQQPSGMPVHRYGGAGARGLVEPGTRAWLDRPPGRAPLWSSVDLRDGNQALANPMDLRRKREMFDLLVRLGFKDIEVGYPSASEAEFAFVRHLVTGGHIPDDVTITVFTSARQELIDRTFEAVRGADRAMVHLCHATACLWREVVFRMTPSEVMALARQSAQHMVRLADRAGGDIRFEYSPETFNVTEPEFALEIANTVAEIVEASPERPLTLNLPSTVEMHAPHVFADQVERMHRNLERRDGIILSVHPHNDRGTAVAAAEYALAAGADRVEGTLFGNGERTGNVCLVTLALNLLSRGIDPQLDLSDIPAIRRTVEECNEMPVPDRHPYAGDLVFTAFSGTHQDAIAKGLRHLEDRAAAAGVPAAQLPWDVPYLPIDPRDIGRSYEAIIRVNSQSGKGGIAHVLRSRWGLDLPQELRVELAGVIQRLTDVTAAEVEPGLIWDTFRAEYCDMGGWACFAQPGPDGDDPVDALLTLAREHGVHAEVDHLTGAAAEPATGAAHACYARVLVDHQPVWGVGLAPTPRAATVRAVLSALRRGGAVPADSGCVPHLAGPREGAL
ncbi:2-isopropylmalate synthase [Streptomyces agglomeratus]|uniref:2-isopropylmalate synthase n=2 Tax=Streptomyces agglomeratus TaxID=285458 RepID=A0A1E5P4B3_9ACTN|nr:2-isopropylmalate synthase [Streptomyces agglomeratus]OEJ24398.1 2-isopropylmalate synthase [Streptomyces agglomeratus]OEJ43971.1 2-isopropylmalate synthase [Streptomyces agglomeratus]OEJ54141.1 2-isopropylmalate synthase [Streptomyces agglomeratus]OEJ61513.1 2-isopropylmalate synthase [Streptomyces agglomeratus]